MPRKGEFNYSPWGKRKGPTKFRRSTAESARLSPRREVQILSLGSCGLNGPLRLLSDGGYCPPIWSELGFAGTPYALSSGAALQLLQFASGDLQIPLEQRRLAYWDNNHPTPETRHLVDRTDYIFVQMSTPVEFFHEGVIVNINRIVDTVSDPLKELVDRKLVHQWHVSLWAANEADRAAVAGEILAALPADVPALITSVVSGLRTRKNDVDQMVADLEAVRERLPRPMGLLLFDFRFMPDGRPLEWPAGFKSEQREVASRLGIQTLDLVPLVEKYGAEQILDADQAHFLPNTFEMQAEMMYDMAAGELDLPPLKSLNRPIPWREKPENWTLASREDPVIAQIPEKVRSGLRELHEPRLKTLGVDGSGLGDHYRILLERGDVYSRWTEFTTVLLLEQLPQFDSYAVMQAGLGQLAFALGMAGKRVIAHDIWPHRREAIQAGIDWFEKEGLIKPGLVTVADGFPDRRLMSGSKLAIGLELDLGYDDDRSREVIRQLALLDALLIEPRHFLRKRQPGAEQDALRRELEKVGLWDAGGVRWMDAAYFTWSAHPPDGSAATARSKAKT